MFLIRSSSSGSNHNVTSNYLSVSSSYIPPIPRVKVLRCAFSEGLTSNYQSREPAKKTRLICFRLLVHNADHREVIDVMGCFSVDDQSPRVLVSPCRWKEVSVGGVPYGSTFDRDFESKFHCRFGSLVLDWSESDTDKANQEEVHAALRIMFQ